MTSMSAGREPAIYELAVDGWNRTHPAGTPVRYWPGELRDGPGRTGVTTSDAWLLGGHSPVVAIDTASGGIALTHVEVLSGAEAARVAVAAFARSLQPSKYNEPADGSLILVNESEAYLRTDEDPPRDEQPDGTRPGDWWRLDGLPQESQTLAEIVDAGPRAVDDPPRRSHSFDVMYTGDDLTKAAERWCAQ